MIIRELSRTLRDGTVEALQFDAGVNVIVGPQNAGKSTWLRMLDYLMFESESAAVRFDAAIIEKYQIVAATITIGSRTLTLAREWNGDGSRSTTTVDGERMSLADIETLFFDLMQMPLLRFPQGAIFTSDRTWPTLGWRSLFRHAYRRQDFWSDLVPRQPDSEQHACLLQFLGLAELLYSEELALLVDKRRQISKAENQKDFFFELVQQLAPGLFLEQDLQVGLTEQSIEAAQTRLDGEIGQLVDARSAELVNVRAQTSSSSEDLKLLMDRRALALQSRVNSRSKVEALKARLAELRAYHGALGQETERLSRADVAAGVFSNLRVTHCPACDQSVEGRAKERHRCFLCLQATPEEEGSPDAAARRLKFERDQILAEIAEAEELIDAAKVELEEQERALILDQRELDTIETALRPFQASASQIVPESIALMDQRIGALGNRRQSLERLYDPLRERDRFSREIDRLRREAQLLEGKIAFKEESAAFEEASDWLTEGFNTYLNAIRALDPDTWNKDGAVTVRVSERKATFLIGGKPARPQLGGTLLIYFLFAYQYALLDLVRRPGTHSLGLAVLDLFPDIAKGLGMSEPLGVVMHPFASLAAKPAVGEIQVIATARDFPHSENIRRIPLTHVWQ